ncbi:MAG: hypothetical protein ACREX4_11785 [Gammaproteobacteria bacterium]
MDPRLWNGRPSSSSSQRAIGAYKLALPVPVFGVKLVAGVLEGFEFFPITRDQITMLMEGNACDSSEVFAAFGLTPTKSLPFGSVTSFRPLPSGRVISG